MFQICDKSAKVYAFDYLNVFEMYDHYLIPLSLLKEITKSKLVFNKSYYSVNCIVVKTNSTSKFKVKHATFTKSAIDKFK